MSAWGGMSAGPASGGPRTRGAAHDALRSCGAAAVAHNSGALPMVPRLAFCASASCLPPLWRYSPALCAAVAHDSTVQSPADLTAAAACSPASLLL